MQRLARVEIDAENVQAVSFLQNFAELEQILLRHLPPSVASIFARPEVQGNIVAWYSDLEGQPELLDRQTAQGKQKLAEITPHLEGRLAQIQQLNQTLQQKGLISAQNAQRLTALVNAARQSQVQIYLINNEPVITGWGLANPSQSSPTALPTEAVTKPASPVTKTKHRLCCWLLPLLLLLLALLAWWWFFIKAAPVAEPAPAAEVVAPQPTAEPKVDKAANDNAPSLLGELFKQATKAVVQLPSRTEEHKANCELTTNSGETPQMVIVFDNSHSMLFSLLENKQSIDRFIQQYSAGVSEQQKAHMFRSPNRLETAKTASADVLDQIASNVDIGLVELRQCPSAHRHGYFAPAQRKELAQRISKMYPDENGPGGTPLYDGLQQAVQMVDGVNRDAFILLLSDGVDTCTSSDICALAQQIATQKPRLKINVVDIGDAQAANCVAKATHGEVFTANNQRQVIEMINKAIKPFEQKQECK